MMEPGQAFILATMVGLGLTTGYFIVNVVTSVALAKLQAAMVKRIKAKAKKSTVKQPKTKLCLKCKRNPRPDGGLHCADCQFLGGEKV